MQNNEIEECVNKINENLTDEKQKEVVNLEIKKLINIFYNEIDDLKQSYDEKLDEILMHETFVDKRLIRIENSLNDIEKDIYDDDEMEIVCPYCNYEFSVDISETSEKEVRCPECNNSIELYFDTEDECGFDGCNHDCGSCGFTDCNDNNDDDAK